MVVVNRMPADNVSSTQRMSVRFGATFIANTFRAGFSFLGGVVIANGLGAPSYGDLSFLLGSFAAISQLFEMGTSSAFYTFISNRPRRGAFFSVYFCWLSLQFVITLLAVGVLLPSSVISRVWVGNSVSMILLAFGASFLMCQGWGSVVQLAEASRETVFIQAVGFAQAFAHLLLILVVLQFGWLTVESVMCLLVGEHLVLIIAFGPRLLRQNTVERSKDLSSPALIMKEFVAYCRPLAIYGWVGFLYTFSDRWLLQRFGGSEQQGFFAVGQQFASVSLIATASMLKVFWKEVAEARQRQDHERVQRLYLSITRGLFFCSAWVSCMLIPYSREILGWTVGPGYDAASLTLGIMFLFPIHQSLGQIQGTYFYAVGETAAYVRIGLIMMAVSIPLTFLILAPPSHSFGGLGLGAVGVALKMVILQFIGVTIQAHVIARMNGIVTGYWYQMGVMMFLLGLGWICRWTAGALLSVVEISLVAHWVIVPGSLLYFCGSMVFLWRAPSVIGMNREQISDGLANAVKRFRAIAG